MSQPQPSLDQGEDLDMQIMENASNDASESAGASDNIVGGRRHRRATHHRKSKSRRHHKSHRAHKSRRHHKSRHHRSRRH